MIVTMIQPRLGSPGVKGSMAPLAMGVLSRWTPDGIDLRFIDENIEKIPANLQSDVVAMSVTSLTAKRAYQLADELRSRGIAVVFGGIHPSLLPNEAIAHADVVVKGAGEHAWPMVLKDLESGNAKREYYGNPGDPLEGMTPDRTIFKGKRYGPLEPIQFGRGCPNSCDFCSVHAVYGTSIVHRPVEEVLEEIASLRHRILFFVDDNLFSYGSAFLDLLEKMVRMRVKWIGQASINIAKNPQILKLLKASGCMTLLIGFESVENESLIRMNKAVNTHTDYRTAVREIQKHGIMISGSFVFGYDTDVADSVAKAYRFCEDNSFVHAYFNPLVPMPSTTLYSRLAKEKRFKDERWWLSDTFRYGTLPFVPASASPESIEKACITARRKFDTFRSMLKRCLGSAANRRSLRQLVLFWIANIVYRAEYRRKYGKSI
jgi:radical SAM superfamily enzyme YgiQ (UPF0313 family)